MYFHNLLRCVENSNFLHTMYSYLVVNVLCLCLRRSLKIPGSRFFVKFCKYTKNGVYFIWLKKKGFCDIIFTQKKKTKTLKQSKQKHPPPPKSVFLYLIVCNILKIFLSVLIINEALKLFS